MPDGMPESIPEIANPLSPATPQAIAQTKLLLGEGPTRCSSLPHCSST